MSQDNDPAVLDALLQRLVKTVAEFQKEHGNEGYTFEVGYMGGSFADNKLFIQISPLPNYPVIPNIAIERTGFMQS